MQKAKWRSDELSSALCLQSFLLILSVHVDSFPSRPRTISSQPRRIPSQSYLPKDAGTVIVPRKFSIPFRLSGTV